ncbi:MAG TPA: hypothetical protein VKU02_20190 [Gemmataceae bacterium]|nr:hypothetical protein [Gemmataceae bacterium]
MYSISLAAVLVMVVADRDRLTATNVRTTYGILGPVRQDPRFHPGDDFVLSFDIEGAKANTAGKILYSVGMDITDSQGKVRFRQIPTDQEADAPAGGKGLPACASLQIGLDQDPGAYTVRVTVKDRVAGTHCEITRTCQILPKEFGLVRLTTTLDPEGKIPTAFLQQSKPGWINFAAVGFGRAKSGGQPHVSVVMRVSDEAGRSALAKPSMGEITKDVPSGVRALPMQFALEINRTGKFTVELTATDQVSGQSVKASFPITVTTAK